MVWIAMEKDEHVTEVIFRKYKDHNQDILALFPYEIESGYSCLSYQHIGQHGMADYNHCLDITRPAKKRRNYDKFLMARHNRMVNV
jgi:hypothetical protein